MKKIITAVLAVVAGVAFMAPSASAQTYPNCGGQGAPVHDATPTNPYICDLPGRDISATLANGTVVTRHFAARVTVNGIVVSVTYLMTGGVLPVDVPIRIVHHEGVSGAGGDSTEARGFILKGTTTATLTDSVPCRNGQLDVKAVNTANNSGDNYRVGGPWILNGTQEVCLVAATTTTTVAPTTTVAATTVPGQPTTTAVVGSPTSVLFSQVRSTLPATGNDLVPLTAIAIVLLALGALVLIVRARSSF